MADFENIIVAAGSAGCVLANRLRARYRVLLLEAGGRDNSHRVHIPIGCLYHIGNHGPTGATTQPANRA